MIRLSRWLFAGLVLAPTAFCAQVAVGDIIFGPGSAGTNQFYFDNSTGPIDGCSTPSGFPVCTSLQLSGTLTYSFTNGTGTVNGTATLSAPIGPNSTNGGNSYAPLNFQFSTADNFVSATFSGTLAPVNFTLDTGPFSSNGLVVSADVIAGGGSAVLFTNSAIAGNVPEPSTAALFIFGGLALLPRFAKARRS